MYIYVYMYMCIYMHAHVPSDFVLFAKMHSLYHIFVFINIQVGRKE